MDQTTHAFPPVNGTVVSGPPSPPYLAPHQLGVQPAHAALPAASPIPVPEPTVHVMPSGHTVTIASPRILMRGQRHQLVAMARNADNIRDGGFATTNALITWLVVGWSYPFPIPSADPASLDTIPLEDDDTLIELVVPPANALLFPKAPSPDDHADPESPTAPSGE